MRMFQRLQRNIISKHFHYFKNKVAFQAACKPFTMQLHQQAKTQASMIAVTFEPVHKRISINIPSKVTIFKKSDIFTMHTKQVYFLTYMQDLLIMGTIL